MTRASVLGLGWGLAVTAAISVRVWNALSSGLMWGYDAWGHVAYVLFLDLYRAVPFADQGWSYFHPPLHYALGWLLAQSGDGEVLVRGLSLLGGAASLGIALVAARLTRFASPDSPGLALLAFIAVAFLPVQLIVGNMPGNEMTLGVLSAAALLAFIANEARQLPRPGLDLVCGLCIGAALLTKFSGLLPLLVVAASLALRALGGREPGRGWLKAAGRFAAIAAVAGVLAFPYYARNISEFGTPFELSRGYPLIQQVERDQPPGARSVSDYLRLSPKLFSDPNPLAPHLLHSIWGTVYLNVWSDIYRESDVERALESERRVRPALTRMALAGIAPTLLAAIGALLALRDVRRGRRRAVYVPMLLLATATVGAFVLFTWRVPIWSAVKASYLLGLSLPYGVFLARGVEELAGRGPAWFRALPATAVVVVAAFAATVSLVGVVLPRRADAPATGALHFYFGDYARASAIYGRLLAGARYKAGWMDNQAAVRLAEGDAETARKLYARAVETGLPDPHRRGRLAAATALAGDLAGGRSELDLALSEASEPELLANRGAIRAGLGDFAGAEADLRAATAASAEIVPAWRNLALVLQRQGRTDESEAAWAGAIQAACTGPRGYPYGLGTGEVIQWGVGQRWLLLLGDDGVELATRSFFRGMCRALPTERAASGARSAR